LCPVEGLFDGDFFEPVGILIAAFVPKKAFELSLPARKRFMLELEGVFLARSLVFALEILTIVNHSFAVYLQSG
jgi:hypothetical protein